MPKANGLKPYYNNKNLSKKIRKGKVLLVDEIFYSIQTEGPFAGLPATFIRLFGCSLSCSFCDTPQDKKEKLTVEEILKRVENIAGTDFIVITGGEPFLQDLGVLVPALIKKKFWIQYETSGFLPLKGVAPDLEGTRIVMSPKTMVVDRDVAMNTLCFKYVVSGDNVSERDGLPKGVFRPQKSMKGAIAVSPMWSSDVNKRSAAYKKAIATSLNYGYHFTHQYHKLIGIQ